MEFIDIGVNLTNRSLMADLDAVLERAGDAGVRQIIVTGTSIDESQQAIALCERFPGRLFSTCGIHPHHASEWAADSLDRLRTMARLDCVRAIGETGLDFNRNYSPPQAQERAFQQQIELAIELGMPLFCHQRDAHQRFVELLAEYRDRIERLVVHCFTDHREALLHYLDLDCYIGITGWICDERRGLELQQLVSLIPANRLLIETDAPYLLPRDLDPKPPGRINEPAFLPHILRAVARHRGESAALLARQCLDNSRVFFEL
ncbi:MAG: TatD family hydrolase [Gammaproteobacteria bacterium]|nr:TatD family hydrolase [Gammaproteobacteria bacterium]MDH3536828.1 TatD family hydrolase [Gammaproteobacteria bacterium]